MTRKNVDDAHYALVAGATGSFSESDVEWLRDKMEEMAGTRNLEEANRRMDVVQEYRKNR